MNPAPIKLHTPLDGTLVHSARIADAVNFRYGSASNRPRLS